MQNIDPIFILQPLIVIVVCSMLLLYWFHKRHFHLMLLVYSLVPYALAIALKYAVQIPTINMVTGYFGAHSVGLGLYYGLQTVFFEVGLAFLFAWYGVKHGHLGKKDAEGYGSALAFWENAALLGILPLINLVTYYGILSTNTSIATTLYNQLQANAPNLFAPASQALGSVVIGTLERISSIMIHFAWGYLVIMAAVYNKKRLFLIALPMGLVDFLVPFASADNLILFEGVVFALAVVSVAVAYFATRLIIRSAEKQPQPMSPQA